MFQNASTPTLEILDDIALLNTQITLPLEPQHARWQVLTTKIPGRTPLPGGEYSALIAVLDFTPAQLEQLKTLSGPLNSPYGLSTHALNIQPWLPQEIQAATAPSTIDPEFVTIDLPGYSAEPFVAPTTGWRPSFWVQVGESSQIWLVLTKAW